MRLNATLAEGRSRCFLPARGRWRGGPRSRRAPALMVAAGSAGPQTRTRSDRNRAGHPELSTATGRSSNGGCRGRRRGRVRGDAASGHGGQGHDAGGAWHGRDEIKFGAAGARRQAAPSELGQGAGVVGKGRRACGADPSLEARRRPRGGGCGRPAQGGESAGHERLAGARLRRRQRGPPRQPR